MQPKRPDDLVVLGIDITHWTARNQFIFCFLGVFVCFLLYGIAQEHIMLTWKNGGVHLGWFLTMAQCLFYSLFTWLAFSSSHPKRKEHDDEEIHYDHQPAPFRSFFIIGALSVSTIGLSNTAIEYVSYPTQVAFKSSKPIPVMLAGICITGKRYSFLEYIATICLCVGLILFATADKEISVTAQSSAFAFEPSFGVFILCIALIVDGVIGNVQQQIFSSHKVSPAEMIMKTKGVAAFLAFFICLVEGQLQVAFDFSIKYPESLVPLFAYSLCGVVGESFVMALIKRFGALAAVITTSVRKAFTMIISFFLFSRPWTPTYLLAAILVWLGVALHIWGDHFVHHHHQSKQRKEEHHSNEPQESRV